MAKSEAEPRGRRATPPGRAPAAGSLRQAAAGALSPYSPAALGGLGGERDRGGKSCTDILDSKIVKPGM